MQWHNHDRSISHLHKHRGWTGGHFQLPRSAHPSRDLGAWVLLSCVSAMSLRHHIQGSGTTVNKEHGTGTLALLNEMFQRAFIQFSSLQSLSRVQLFATPWTAACRASLSITNSRSSPKLMSIESVMSSSHLIFCRPLLLLPPIPPSIGVFSNESTLRMRWPKYRSFSFSISPSNEYLGLISFRMDWLDLLAVQGTLKSLLQHHSLKASILQRSAFFTVQLSHPYMTTGKTIALTRRTFVGKVMSLLLNMLSRLVITFLPGSRHLLISWLQSPSAVILEPQKIKSDTVSPVSPSISHEVLISQLIHWWSKSHDHTQQQGKLGNVVQLCVLEKRGEWR